MLNLPQLSNIVRIVVLWLILGLGFHSSVMGEETARDRVIQGKVVDSEGKPVPVADVWCSPYAKSRFPVVTVRTGADGTFAVTVPPADEYAFCPDRLWAFAPGYSVAFGMIPDSREEQSRVRLVLGPPSDFHVLVNQPDGKPAKNAVVLVPALGIKTERHFGIAREHFVAPGALVTLTAATTDELGVAAIPAWKGEDVLKVDVVTPSFGRQTCYFPWDVEGRPGTSKFSLLPAEKVHGRVVADGPCALEGLAIHIKTMSTPEDHSYGVYAPSPPFLLCETTVITDSQGRFESPRIAHGWLNIKIQDGLNKPFQYLAKTPLEFRGDPSELVIRLRKAVHISGRLRLFNSDARPSQFRIAGCETRDTPQGSYAFRFFANIDDQGRFDFYSLPGIENLCVVPRQDPELDRVPGWQFLVQKTFTYYYSLSGECWERRVSRIDPGLHCPRTWYFKIPEGVDDFECPPIELCQVRGRVRGEGGKLISEVTMEEGCWPCTADEQGRFCVLLDRRLCRIGFNRYATGVLRQPDGAWQLVTGLGKAPEYESREIDCGMEQFPDGVLPDVILPLRNSETVKELKESWPKMPALHARQMEEESRASRTRHAP
jgi:hypothetical protein